MPAPRDSSSGCGAKRSNREPELNDGKDMTRNRRLRFPDSQGAAVENTSQLSEASKPPRCKGGVNEAAKLPPGSTNKMFGSRLSGISSNRPAARRRLLAQQGWRKPRSRRRTVAIDHPSRVAKS